VEAVMQTRAGAGMGMGTEAGTEQVSNHTRQVVERVKELHSGGKIL